MRNSRYGSAKSVMSENERSLLGIEMKRKNDCIYWGENRPDELFLDVGCVLGHSWCDPRKCPDYYPIKKYKKDMELLKKFLERERK